MEEGKRQRQRHRHRHSPDGLPTTRSLPQDPSFDGATTSTVGTETVGEASAATTMTWFVVVVVAAAAIVVGVVGVVGLPNRAILVRTLDVPPRIVPP